MVTENLREFERISNIKLENLGGQRNRQRMKKIVTFYEHLDQRYGKIGTKERTDFEIKAKAFAIGEIIRDARKEGFVSLL